jgi:hypothetical protein
MALGGLPAGNPCWAFQLHFNPMRIKEEHTMLCADWTRSLVARRFPAIADSRRILHVVSGAAMIAALMAVSFALAPFARAAESSNQPNFGPNVYIFTPNMPLSQIQATVDTVATQQVSNQFGTQRYALLFEPGTYGSSATPLNFQVGYYTTVAASALLRTTSSSTGPSTCTTSAAAAAASRPITSGDHCRTWPST